MALGMLLYVIQHIAYGYSVHAIISQESFLQGVSAASPARRVLALSACGLVAGCGWWAVRRFGSALVSISEAIHTQGRPMPFLTTVAHALLQIVTVALGSPLGREGAPRDEGLRRDYQKLIAIRKAHPALSRGSHLGLSAEGDLYVFVRRDGSDAVIVAVNRGNAPASAKVAVPAEWGEAPAVDLLDGSAVSREGGSLSLTVGPRQARIVGTH